QSHCLTHCSGSVLNGEVFEDQIASLHFQRVGLKSSHVVFRRKIPKGNDGRLRTFFFKIYMRQRAVDGDLFLVQTSSDKDRDRFGQVNTNGGNRFGNRPKMTASILRHHEIVFHFSLERFSIERLDFSLLRKSKSFGKDCQKTEN